MYAQGIFVGESCVFVCMYMHGGVCVCVCLYVCMYMGDVCVCALCISTHLYAHTEVLGGALEGSLRPRAQLGAQSSAVSPARAARRYQGEVSSPAQSPCPEYLSTFSCN